MGEMIISYETQSVHNSIVDALVAQEVERRLEEYRKAEAMRTTALLKEIDRLRGQLVMRKAHDGRLYAQVIAGAERDYGQKRRPLRAIGDIWWGAVGLLVEGAGEIIDAIRESVA